ncbi:MULTISPECIES: thioesterase family protein [unclassified Sulfitobacter]|uniref:thioesterase family protein n=1 Tax=unclassified Sulfitobacter TaxID=196795 RepID=UPI0007C2B026|nr:MULTISPECIES: thioesterase family protein [unclassified Sulfitobacter]KZX95353.1 thioesterase [Sulfitobacter sp. HI0023]KZY26584.1 thioesterase [Sulfitobacter sp. HI0040]KZZ65754.1 thioesterase [Sulfitobacter sp. HI0129]
MSAPFRSSMMRVRPEWIDFNGHLNMAYYNVLFDTSVDQAYELLGFGPDYQKTGCTTYVAEFHVCYVRELHENDEVFVTLQILDHDAKRFHTYQELYHADGWLAATAEGLTLHVDQSGPRVAEMPPHIRANLGRMAEDHAKLPRPERAGRSIGIRRRKAG